MDANAHDVAAAHVLEWFGDRTGHSMTVTAHDRGESRFLATGPFLRVEEHPEAHGVYRAVFDDSLTSGTGATQYFAFGSELQSAESDAGRLVLDKGAQQIEVIDRTAPAPAARLTAEQVSWADEPVPPAMPVPVAQPAVPQPAVPPPAPPPAPAPPNAAPLSASPDTVDLTVKAPMYGNALGTLFFGEVNVKVEHGWMTVTGMRGTSGGQRLVGGVLLWVFGGIMVLLGAAISTDASSEHLGALTGITGLALIAVGLLLFFAGRASIRHGASPSSVHFELAKARGRKVRYDSGLGCLLMILLSPLIGLIIMLVMGRRTANMTAPTGPGGRMQQLALKTLNVADGALLGKAIRG